MTTNEQKIKFGFNKESVTLVLAVLFCIAFYVYIFYPFPTNSSTPTTSPPPTSSQIPTKQGSSNNIQSTTNPGLTTKPSPTTTAPTTSAPALSKVNCVVSDWSPLSTCSATCGGGVQIQTRSIITEPKNGGTPCPALTNVVLCNKQTCDCEVSDWSTWSECSKPCGSGIQTRTRSILKQPEKVGSSCPPLSETQTCNPQSCPECVVSDWVLGQCSVECGGGTQSMTRTIIQPAGPGLTCPPLTSSQSCNTADCQVIDYSNLDLGNFALDFTGFTLDFSNINLGLI